MIVSVLWHLRKFSKLLIKYLHTQNPLWGGVYFRPTRDKNMVWQTKRHRNFRVFKG